MFDVGAARKKISSTCSSSALRLAVDGTNMLSQHSRQVHPFGRIPTLYKVFVMELQGHSVTW